MATSVSRWGILHRALDAPLSPERERVRSDLDHDSEDPAIAVKLSVVNFRIVSFLSCSSP